MREHEKTDFTINGVPKDVTFECPHCGESVELGDYDYR